MNQLLWDALGEISKLDVGTEFELSQLFDATTWYKLRNKNKTQQLGTDFSTLIKNCPDLQINILNPTVKGTHTYKKL